MSAQEQAPDDPASPARSAYEHARDLAAQDAAHRAHTERLLLRFADLLDSFDRLLADGREGDVETYRGSVARMARQLETALQEEGVETIGRPGERAEPASHHVVEVRRTPGAGADEVVETQQRGYRYRGRVLRAARVAVASGDDGTEKGTDRE